MTLRMGGPHDLEVRIGRCRTYAALLSLRATTTISTQPPHIERNASLTDYLNQ